MNEQIRVESGEAIGVTKMSVNQICGKTVRGDICVIIGKANGLKTGEDNNGKMWCAITGVFEGTNLQTKKKYRSGKLFLPSGTQEGLESAVRLLPGFSEGNPTGAVKFAIGFRRVDADNPIGYSYETVNLLPMETQTDDLADLISAATVKVPVLAETSPQKQIAQSTTEAPMVETPKEESTTKKKK